MSYTVTIDAYADTLASVCSPSYSFKTLSNSANTRMEVATDQKGPFIDSKEINLFPNPTNGVIHISRKGPWKVLSISGEVLMAGTHSSIDLRGYSSGIYMVIIQGRAFRVVKS